MKEYRNSVLKDIKDCHKKAYWRHIRNLVPLQENINLVAGSAFADAMKTLRTSFYKERKPINTALDDALQMLGQSYGNPACPSYGKTLPKLEGALYAYIEKWPLENDTPISIETRLFAPVGQFAYSGKPDCIYETANGDLLIVDEKITSKLDDAWSSTWNLDTQFSAYTYLTKFNYSSDYIAGVQIRGIGLHRDGPHCVEIPITRMGWELDRWHADTIRQIKDFEESIRTNHFPMRADWNCKYCEYKQLCDVREPELHIEANFREREKDEGNE